MSFFLLQTCIRTLQYFRGSDSTSMVYLENSASPRLLNKHLENSAQLRFASSSKLFRCLQLRCRHLNMIQQPCYARLLNTIDVSSSASKVHIIPSRPISSVLLLTFKSHNGLRHKQLFFRYKTINLELNAKKIMIANQIYMSCCINIVQQGLKYCIILHNL